MGKKSEEPVKVLVCGGRNFNNRQVVHRVLTKLNPDIVVHGGASGADKLAGEWAEENGKEERIYYAKWGLHGKAAGPMRNKEMLEKEIEGLNGVIAFPGGRGTQDMINRARHALGIDKVVEIKMK